jgi:hypothetical protein
MSKIKAKILDQTDQKTWDKFVEYSPWADIFQTWEWGDLQKKEGSKPLRIAIIKDGYLVLAVQILIKNISVLGSYGSIIHGPIFTSSVHLKEALPVLVNFLSNLTKNYNLAFLEIEPVFGDFAEVLESSKNQNDDTNSLAIYEQNNLDQFGDLAKLNQSQFLEIFLENGFNQALPATYKQEKKWYLNLSKEFSQTSSIDWKLQRYQLDDPLVAKISKYIKQILDQKNIYSDGLLEPNLFENFIHSFESKENLELWVAHKENTVLALNLFMTSKFWSGSLFSLAVGDDPKTKQILTDLQILVINQVIKNGGKIFDLGIFDKNHQSLKETPDFLQKTVRINTSGNLLLPISPLKYSLWDTYYWLKSDGKKDFQKASSKALSATGKTSNQIWKETKKQTLVIWQKTRQEIDKLKTRINSQIEQKKRNSKITQNQQNSDLISKNEAKSLTLDNSEPDQKSLDQSSKI